MLHMQGHILFNPVDLLGPRHNSQICIFMCQDWLSLHFHLNMTYTRVDLVLRKSYRSPSIVCKVHRFPHSTQLVKRYLKLTRFRC